LSFIWTAIVNIARQGKISRVFVDIITFEVLSAPMADTGLQPLNAFLVFFPFIISLTVVAIRVWRRTVERQFAIGKMSVFST
jgi:glycopeptide antibiotics resistance protein